MKRSPMPKQSKKRRAYRASSAWEDALAYMGAVKRLPCVVCGGGPCDAHHVYHGRYSGRKTSDLDVIPLCKWDHQDGPESIHRDKAGWMERNGPDWGYIEQTRRAVAALTGE